MRQAAVVHAAGARKLFCLARVGHHFCLAAATSVRPYTTKKPAKPPKVLSRPPGCSGFKRPLRPIHSDTMARATMPAQRTTENTGLERAGVVVAPGATA